MTKRTGLLKTATAFAALILSSLPALSEEIVWWSPNWGEARAQEMVKQFEAANPDVTVRLEVTVANGLQNRILTVLRSGSPPDLIDASMQWVAPFAATGKLMALDEFAKNSSVKLDDLLPASIDYSSYDGKLYGLPYRAQTLGMIYNKGLYREAGLDPDKPPQTWDELIDASKKLTRTNAKGQPQYGMGIAGGGENTNMITRLVPFIWMNGGDIFSEDGKTAVVNSPETVEAVKFYTDMLTVHKAAPPSTLQNDGTALRRLFATGTIAQYLAGQFDLPALAKEAPDIEIGVAPFPHPTGKDTSGMLAGWAFLVPSESQHAKATLRFVEFLMKPENQGFYTDTFPASQSAMSLPRFQEPLLQPFKEMLAFTRPAPNNPAWIQATQSIFSHVQEVFLGSTTPQEAMDAANAEIQGVLK